MSVERGGRERERMAKEVADAKAEAERLRLERLSDLRTLMHRAEFRRVVKHLVARSGCFIVPNGLPHDQLREHLGAAALGMELWNDIVAADEASAVQLLNLTKKEANG